MTEASDDDYELSSSWTLIQLNKNKEPSFVLETDEEQNLQSSSSTIKNDIQIENSNLNQESQGANEGDQSLTQNDFFKANIPKKVESIASIDENTNVQDKNSDDGDSIEIIDLEGDYRDVDIHEQDISLDEQDEEKDFIDDILNTDEACHDNENSNNEESETNLRKRRKITQKKTLTLTSLSGAVTCGEPLDLYEKDTNLKVQIYRSESLPLYYQYGNKLKNVTISLTCGVLFAGIVCLVIGQILGVHNSSEDLMKTLKTLKLENAALQSELSKINTAFFVETSNFYSKQYVYTKGKENDLMEKDKPITENNMFAIDNSSIKHLSESQLNERNSRGQYLKKMKKRKSLADFSKILNYIEHRLSGLNVNYNQVHFKRLEESTAKISDILQAILRHLSSDNNPTRLDKKSIKAHRNKKTLNLSKGPLPGRTPFEFNWKFDKSRIRSPTSLYTFPQPQSHYTKTFSKSGKNSRENMAMDSDFHPLKTPSGVEGCEGRDERFKYSDVNIPLRKGNNSIKYDDSNKRKKLPHSEVKKKITKLTSREKFVKKVKDGVKSKKRKILIEGKDKKFKAVNKKLKKSKYHKGRVDGTNYSVRMKAQKLHEYEKVKENHYGGSGDVLEVEGMNFKEDDHNGSWQFERAEARKKRRCYVGDVSKNGDWMFRWADGRKEFRKENGNENWQFQRANGRNEMRQGPSFK